MKLSNVGQRQNMAFGSRFTQIAELVKRAKSSDRRPDIKHEAERIRRFAEKISNDGLNLRISLMTEPYKEKETLLAYVYDESKATFTEQCLGKAFPRKDNEGVFSTNISKEYLKGIYKNAVKLYKQSVVKAGFSRKYWCCNDGKTTPKSVLKTILYGINNIKNIFI